MKYKNFYFFWILLFNSIFFVNCTCSDDKFKLKIVRSETFFNNLSGEPETLHPIKSTDYFASVIQYYILESLLQRNEDSYEWEPSLAKKWEISSDGKTFTFELYDNLKWSDGKPLTTQDVKFSFEAYKNPEYGGIRYLSYFEKIDSAKILNDKKIQFTIKDAYFKNFEILSNMDIIPEHIYKDPKTRLSKTVIGSGPYVLDRYIRGKILVLKKNPLWAGTNNPVNKGKWRFPTIVFRFIMSKTDSLLRMEKGHLDYTDLTPEDFFEKTKQPPWGTQLKKVKYSNKSPSNFGYIAFNFKKPLFQDLKVRKALAHLLNRRLINNKFHYNQSELARGPWYFWNDYADPNVPPIEFNPKKAIAILKSAGWDDRDQNGILEKTINGKTKELSWTIIYPNPDSEKYLTLYQEDLKQAGIKLNLKILDWTSLLGLLDDKNFESVMLGWTGSIEGDPKQIWHSKSAQKGGSNYISYSNPQVDALIDLGRTQMDKQKRIKLFKKVYQLIAKDVPYIFMFNTKNKFYGNNKRVHTSVDTLNYSVGMAYWSLKSQ